MKVVFKKASEESINKIADYIAKEIKMPETALKYVDKMQKFALSIGNFPDKYPLCRDARLARKQLRCATFDKKWIFAYKTSSENVTIYHILWGPSLK